MKVIHKILVPVIFTAALPAAQAIPIVETYHVEAGYSGTVTVRAAGGCAIAPTTIENAALGEVINQSDVVIGWGIVANGQVVALLRSDVTVSDKFDGNAGKGIRTTFEDFSSAGTASYIESAAGCAIDVLDTSNGAKGIYRKDYPKGIDNATVNYKFMGYTDTVCVYEGAKHDCRSKKFTGSILFKSTGVIGPVVF